MKKHDQSPRFSFNLLWLTAASPTCPSQARQTMSFPHTHRMWSCGTASLWTVVLVSLLSQPIQFYVNVSTRMQSVEFPRPSQATDAIVTLHPLVGEKWSLTPSTNNVPIRLEINQSGAASIAVNFKQLKLLPGDKLVVRSLNDSISITITANTSDSKIGTGTHSPSSLLLRTHPFLIQGDKVVIEYFPSIPTLLLPLLSTQRAQVGVVVDSYEYVTYSSSMVRFDTESTVGAMDEAKEAVCYRKTEPQMYSKARAVARLMIRSNEEQKSTDNSEQSTSFAFCTGWLIGQGNYLLTNHHCMTNAAIVKGSETSITYWSITTFLHQIWPRSRPEKASRIVEAIVNFMAETKGCRDAGFMGEKAGVVEATEVLVVAESAMLDYALLQVLTNDSTTDLARHYGYLRLRATGPVNGEAIYIPQHPRGEPKEIAAMKDGKPALIEVLAPNLIDSSKYFRFNRKRSIIQPSVWYNADTEPGSSGSPVISQRDNTVVALHRAGNAETSQSSSAELFNMGVRIDLIARDLQRRKLLPRNSVAL